MKRQYERGASLERRLVGFLRMEGVQAVRTAGSKGSMYGYPVDVLAVGSDGCVYMIQVSAGKRSLPRVDTDLPERISAVFLRRNGSVWYIHLWNSEKWVRVGLARTIPEIARKIRFMMEGSRVDSNR